MMANYLNDDNMKFIPCQFRNDICIGGIDNSEEYIEKRKWKKKKKFIMFMTIRKKKKKKVNGTSFSSPLVVGIAATIMSENPNTKYTKESILQILKNLCSNWKRL